jgi:hypothetical protein
VICAELKSGDAWSIARKRRSFICVKALDAARSRDVAIGLCGS